MYFNASLEMTKVHQEDMEQRANQWRLVKVSQAGAKNENAVLAAVGRQMIAMGHKLETIAQSSVTETTTLQPDAR
jgi:hypothetical protein